MRTSNKILLGTFISVTVLLVGIHVSLNAKYSNGSFTVIPNKKSDRFNVQILPAVKYVTATGLNHFNIISSDTLKLETEKNHSSQLRVKVEGETLIISGDTLIKRNSFEDRQKTYSPVTLYLPSSIKLKIDFSEVQLKGSRDSSSAKSYEFDLTETNINIGDEWGENGDNPSSRFWKQLDIKASKKSFIRLFTNAKISGLNLQLNESSIQDISSDIGQFTLQTDDKSSVNLSGATFKKLNLSPKQ